MVLMELDLNTQAVEFKGFYKWPIQMVVFDTLQKKTTLKTGLNSKTLILLKISKRLTFLSYSLQLLPTIFMSYVDKWNAILENH